MGEVEGEFSWHEGECRVAEGNCFLSRGGGERRIPSWCLVAAEAGVQGTRSCRGVRCQGIIAACDSNGFFLHLKRVVDGQNCRRQPFMMVVRMVVAIEQAVEHRAFALIAEHHPGASLSSYSKK